MFFEQKVINKGHSYQHFFSLFIYKNWHIGKKESSLHSNKKVSKK